MSRWRQQRGRSAERLARRVLEDRGYEILDTNVRTRLGELDLIARQGATLCFVEVRSSGAARFGHPAGSIDRTKRRHLIRAAQAYLQRFRGEVSEVRFDVVAVIWTDGQPTVELIPGAFTADDR